MVDVWINSALLSFLIVVALAIVRMQNLFSVVILSGVYSSLMVGIMVVLDAVDVAMTELAVGTGVSTGLMLAVLYLTKTSRSRQVRGRTFPYWFVAMIVGVLVYAVWAPIPFAANHVTDWGHVASYYLENSLEDTGIPNVVTSVLASYRGFDTLGETAVVFAAGIAVLSLLGGEAHREKNSFSTEDAVTEKERKDEV